MRNTGSKVPVRDVIDYWSSRIDELEFSVDWRDADIYCWRCSHKTRALQRCHIVPHSLGGTDQPSNLVLLCGRCHLENPNTSDPKYFWMWLDAHRSLSLHGMYNTYWFNRGIEEYRKVFGREPFLELNGASVSPDQIIKAFSDLSNKVSKHFGDNGLNPATIAWIIHCVEASLSSQLRGEAGLLFPL